MVTMARQTSSRSLPLPNTFFDVLPLLLPMAGRWGSSAGRSVQELVPMIMRPDLIEDVENDQRSYD